MQLAGKSALLTGATGGLGRAIAEALSARGVTLVLSGRQAEALEELAAGLPGEHRIAPADLSEEGAAEALLATTGELDILVANAALPGTGDVEEYSGVQIERLLKVNLEAPIKLARGLLPGMRARDSGHLVFMSSLSGLFAAPASSLYSASKFGLRGFALALREDLRGVHVGVSVVSPGAIADAGMFADSGAKAPPFVGAPKTSADVGAAVVRAIEDDRAEIEVATLRATVGAKFAGLVPELSGRVSNRQAKKVAVDIASGQLDKRPPA